MATAFDSFSELFEDKKKNKKEFIVKKYPASKKSVLKETEEFIKENVEEAPQQTEVEKTPISSFQKLSDKIANNLYEPPREVTLAPPEPPPVVDKQPIKIGKTLRFLRKLRSWVAAPFISKMIDELNKRLETFQKNYDDKFAQLSYNAYTTGAVGGGGTQTVIQQITGKVKPKFFNNSSGDIDDKVLVTLNDNDILDDTLTTVRQLLNGTDEPLGISNGSITQDNEGEVTIEGTIKIPFSTLNLPVGTDLYSGASGEITSTINTWKIGKTVNQALNGKIYFKVQKAFDGTNEEAAFLGLPQR